MKRGGGNREREAKQVFVPHTCSFSELVSRTIAHLCVNQCIIRTGWLAYTNGHVYTSFDVTGIRTGCYLNFSSSKRIINPSDFNWN